MYTPFLRGRKFDLEALVDLTLKASNYANGKVIPIIEPVSFKKDCIKSYYKLVTTQTPFILISNPIAGDITPDDVEKKLINGTLSGYNGYYTAFLISQQTTLIQVQDFINRFSDRKISFIHYSMSGQNDSITSFINSLININHHIFLTKWLTTKYTNSINSPGAKKITVIDSFNKLLTNAAYLANTTEYFSDLHKTFKNSGFDGFGDFSIMGEKFEEGNGRARAVVIHWPFINQNDRNIYIQHFVSDNITGTEDISGKFGEAYRKLSAFRREDSLHVDSVGHFLISKKGDKGESIQLGAIKKYSIMHHIELTRSLLI